MHYLVQLHVMNSWNHICSSDIHRVLPNQKTPVETVPIPTWNSYQTYE